MQTTEETQMEIFVDEDMDSRVVVSHEHTLSAPVLAHKIPSEDKKEEPSMVICGGLSTVPSADVEPEKRRKLVGAPTLDQTPTGETNVGLVAGKDQYSDQKGDDLIEVTTVEAGKVSHEHIPPDTYRVDHSREI